MENISQINPYEKMLYWNNSPSSSRRRKIRKRTLSRRSRGRFHALTRMASDIHQNLIDKGSPLRLCVHGNDEDQFMDVITMDDNKKVSQSFTRSIKDESLKTLVKRIHHQLGLVFDYTV